MEGLPHPHADGAHEQQIAGRRQESADHRIGSRSGEEAQPEIAEEIGGNARNERRHRHQHDDGGKQPLHVVRGPVGGMPVADTASTIAVTSCGWQMVPR